MDKELLWEGDDTLNLAKIHDFEIASEILSWIIVILFSFYAFITPSVEINKTILYCLAIAVGIFDLIYYRVIAKISKNPARIHLKNIFDVATTGALIYLLAPIGGQYLFFLFLIPIVGSIFYLKVGVALSVYTFSVILSAVVFYFSAIPAVQDKWTILIFQSVILLIISFAGYLVSRKLPQRRPREEKEKPQDTLLSMMRKSTPMLEEEKKIFQEDVEKNESRGKYLGWGVFFALSLCAYLFIFTNYPFTSEVAFKGLGVTLSIQLFYHWFLFNRINEKSPQISLQVDSGFFVIAAIFMTHLLGGITTPAFSLYAVAILGGAIALGAYYAFAIAGIEVAALALLTNQSPFQQDFFTKNKEVVIFEIVILIVSALLSFIFAKRYRTILDRKNRSEKITNDLVADKVKSESILRSMGDGVFMVDLNRRLIYMNKSAREMIKLTISQADKAMKRPYWKVFEFKLRGKKISYDKNDPIQSAITEGTPKQSKETSLLTAFRKEIDISLYTAPVIDAKGDAVGGIAVMRDISKEKKMEKLQMEFVSIASHELMTPLALVEGHLSMIIDEGIGKVDNTAKNLVENAYKGSKRITRLVKDLLNISRIEQGRMKTVTSPTPLEEIITTLVHDFEQEEKEKGVKLIYKKPAKPLPLVQADRDRVNEILTNLVGNAFKFTHEGSITIDHEIKQKTKMIVTNVTDTGIGISKEYTPSLFKKFYQVDTSATREAEGTGLGLYISQTIVEMMGGKIWVESTPGKGSKFSFSLPFAGKEIVDTGNKQETELPAVIDDKRKEEIKKRLLEKIRKNK